MSLRVEDTSVEKSNDGEIVDFIFSKDASVSKYDTLLVEEIQTISFVSSGNLFKHGSFFFAFAYGCLFLRNY